ncbi:LemA family protein [Selenomonas ruminis]|uniref:LemA family protein n=1 Tax=Selenomonas ruminis TaxID=2593411 RepID=A0A5D6W9C3_9FIRM|nr:LemA family protein [Selenomonas sp. mPRGC5]TYZ24883.1 LemA family protein [Selenomonas sp. mPRGC5]
MNKSGLILLVLVAFVAVFGISTYNSVKSARIEIDAQYGQAENPCPWRRP